MKSEGGDARMDAEKADEGEGAGGHGRDEGDDGEDGQGPAKKLKQFTWEDLARKIKSGVCAGAGDMAIDEVEAADWDVNVEETELVPTDMQEDVREGEFDPKELAKARGEEVEFMEGIGVWEPATEEECIAATGKPPVSTRWVDVNKGRGGEVDLRCRIVARDFKVKGDGRESEVFAAMPPIEAKRMLFRMAALKGSVKGDPRRGVVKLMFIDIKKAHLNGKLREDEFAFVWLPAEAGGGVGRLRRWLYGMRPAATAWEEEYAEVVEKELGFARWRSAPTVFWHEKSGVRLVVWGDDFTLLGREADLLEFRDALSKKYILKVRGVMGPEPGDDKHIRILNRSLTWGDEGLLYEGDEQHVATVVGGMGLNGDSKGLGQAAYREDDGEDDTDELDEVAAKRYRSLAMVVNYMSLDRPDLQYAANILGRSMSRPTEKAQMRLKKVARYLVCHPSVEYLYSFGEFNDEVDLVAWSDSDWAGDRVQRKSTTGGLLEIAGGVVKSWCNRQGSIALSSGEAEFYAAGKAAAEGIGASSLLADLGWKARPRVCLDAEAAKGIASRRGLGKMCHLEVRYLWLQEVVRSGRLQLKKVRGTDNPADVLTKPLKDDAVFGLLHAVGVRQRAVDVSGGGVGGKGGCRGMPLQQGFPPTRVSR